MGRWVGLAAAYALVVQTLLVGAFGARLSALTLLDREAAFALCVNTAAETAGSDEAAPELPSGLPVHCELCVLGAGSALPPALDHSLRIAFDVAPARACPASDDGLPPAGISHDHQPRGPPILA